MSGSSTPVVSSGGSGTSGPTVTGGGTSTPTTPTTALCVVQAFGDYARGQIISDAATVTALQASAPPGFTVAVAWPLPTSTAS